ncbi:MAG: hypothetical protein M3Q19_02790 [Pseudomonadota bacterium]|nr:hypothetical protein [Pseudomonadota bacterium]
MRIWGKLVAAAVAPLMLSGCLWGPGKFTSNLALNKAGTFVLDYKGEILLQMPDKDSPPAPWDPKMAVCRTNGETEVVPVEVAEERRTDDEAAVAAGEEPSIRACTTAELAKLKAEYEKSEADKLEAKRLENEQMAKMFGLPGADDESNRRFAANLMKQKGWRSVAYKGKGLFDVDYHFEGRLNQDFAFPLMPDTDLMIPFITIRPRTDGSVKVSAPALVGGAGVFSARAKAMGLPEKGNGPASRAEGRFTITTDGEILTNNSEDGPVAGPGGRQLQWDVGPGSQKVPEMMVRL